MIKSYFVLLKEWLYVVCLMNKKINVCFFCYMYMYIIIVFYIYFLINKYILNVFVGICEEIVLSLLF